MRVLLSVLVMGGCLGASAASAAGEAAPAAPAAGMPAAATAAKTVSLNLKETPLRQALASLFAPNRTRWTVEPDVPDVPVTLALREIAEETALRLVVRHAGKQVPHLTSEVREDGVTVLGIRKPRDASNPLVVKVKAPRDTGASPAPGGGAPPAAPPACGAAPQEGLPNGPLADPSGDPYAGGPVQPPSLPYGTQVVGPYYQYRNGNAVGGRTSVPAPVAQPNLPSAIPPSVQDFAAIHRAGIMTPTRLKNLGPLNPMAHVIDPASAALKNRLAGAGGPGWRPVQRRPVPRGGQRQRR